jgi:hypothetical protein
LLDSQRHLENQILVEDQHHPCHKGIGLIHKKVAYFQTMHLIRKIEYINIWWLKEVRYCAPEVRHSLKFDPISRYPSKHEYTAFCPAWFPSITAMRGDSITGGKGHWIAKSLGEIIKQISNEGGQKKKFTKVSFNIRFFKR